MGCFILASMVVPHILWRRRKGHCFKPLHITIHVLLRMLAETKTVVYMLTRCFCLCWLILYASLVSVPPISMKATHKSHIGISLLFQKVFFLEAFSCLKIASYFYPCILEISNQVNNNHAYKLDFLLTKVTKDATVLWRKPQAKLYLVDSSDRFTFQYI